MKINVKKENEDIVLSLVINEKEESFDYVKLVNELYNKKEIEEIIYSEEINDWEKDEIKKLIDKINDTVKQPDEKVI